MRMIQALASLAFDEPDPAADDMLDKMLQAWKDVSLAPLMFLMSLTFNICLTVANQSE
jgi:hypothetical protein